jgi:hypothetical protein
VLRAQLLTWQSHTLLAVRRGLPAACARMMKARIARSPRKFAFVFTLQMFQHFLGYKITCVTVIVITVLLGLIHNDFLVTIRYSHHL